MPPPTTSATPLAAAYEKGASKAGHEVRKLDIARMEFPLLRAQTEFLSPPQSRDIQEAQEAIRWGTASRHHLPAVAWHDARATEGVCGAGLSSRRGSL
jgi:hypothetical protein